MKTFQFTWLLFNTLKQYFLFDMIAGSAKVFFLFCQIPSILCNTHLPFQSLPNTQLSILQMPNSLHCNESLAAQYHLQRHSFSATGRFISSSISKYWGTHSLPFNSRNFLVLNIFQTQYNHITIHLC